MDILNVSAHPVDRNPNTRSLTFSRQKYLYPNTFKTITGPFKDIYHTTPLFIRSSPKPNPYHPKTLVLRFKS